MENFRKVEGSGIQEDNKPTYSDESKRQLRFMEKSMEHDGDRYKINLLWKNEIKLPNKYPVAKAQLLSLQKRLRKDPETMQLYEKSLTTDLENNYVKPVTFQYPQLELLWYLPHHPVTNPNKPGKVRRVANAASTYKGVSLNSCLETGPDLLNNMFGFLLRFREKPVTVSADIEGMFMQIGIKDEDQNALRFLWPTKNGIKQYQYTRLIFGAKCSPSIAIFALHQTAADYCVTKPIIAQLLHKSFYMDDFVHSFNTTPEARDSTTQLKSSLRQGRFNLTKFVSNTNDAIYSIDGGEVSTNATVHRVLGVKWDTTDDTIFVQPTTKLNNTTSSTLRTVLSTVARVFDPLGILAPFVIKLKILLQNLWKSGISWDKTVPSDFVPIIDKWVD